MLTEPDQQIVLDLLESVRTGKVQPQFESTPFYAAAFSGSGGRTVVRDWIDTTVGDAQRALAKWFTRQRIVGPNGEEPRALGVYALAMATVREAKDLPARTNRALLRAALTATPPPRELLAAAYQRSRSEQTIRHNRAALIKLLLHSEGVITREDAMTTLEADHPSPAYHCGRLMATLERIQRAAIPGITATIIDRYFGAASTTPALVFPRLIRGAQPHLAKLERDRRGAYINLQREVEEILTHIKPGPEGYPARLSFPEQGLFQLGYYHQRAQARADMEARRAAGQPADDEIDPTTPEEEENNE
jgi:CRISPR-associated protein Csd1